MKLPLLIEGRISREQWEYLSEDATDRLAEDIFKHYRSMGFPYYEFSGKEKIQELGKLQAFFDRGGDGIIDENKIRMTMHGLALAWSYFPHSWEVRSNKMKTPFEVYSNDELFMKAIRRRMKRGTYFSESGIRKALRTYSGTQGVSNFRPTAAGAIYKKYCSKGGIVWDMSCGYGGRLLGALISRVVGWYIGTEPCSETFDGLMKMKNELFPSMNATFLKCGSEDFVPTPNTLDLCFTSPPYFNTEKYSDEETQSYKKFESKESWNEKFLRQTIKNCLVGLKDGGHLIINIANVKSHQTLENDTIKICLEEGLGHVETLKLLLSSISKGGYKSEPVFVFRKQG
jgi:hypothetical protein